MKKGEYEDIAHGIFSLLAEASRIPQEIIHALPFEEEKILKSLAYLLAEEQIIQKEGRLYRHE